MTKLCVVTYCINVPSLSGTTSSNIDISFLRLINFKLIPDLSINSLGIATLFPYLGVD
jgi:hypothetical protein